MRFFNAFNCTSLSCVSKLFSFIFAVVLFSVSSQSFGSPLPNFPDPNLQACFDEMATANNWVEAEDADILLCPDRDIQFVDGIEQLTSLVELDLSNNPLNVSSELFLVQAQALEKLNLSGTVLLDFSSLLNLQQLTHLLLNDVTTFDLGLISQQQLLDIIRINPRITHLGLNGFNFDINGISSEYRIFRVE